MRALATALLLLTLAACSDGEGAGDGGRAGIAGLAGDAIRQRVGGEEAEPAVTRERLAALGVEERFIVARLESGASAGLAPIASNRGRLVWASADDIAMTMRGGILFATRGLGGDLLSADTDELLLALAQGRPARYRRVLRRLDGLQRILVQPYDCVLTTGPREVVTVLGRRHETLRSTETCTPTAEADRDVRPAVAPDPFVNVYNVGDGTIWFSRQWVGPAVGHLTLERILE